MTKDNNVLDISVQPACVVFMGKPRMVHYFHRSTNELFSTLIRGTLKEESLKRRKKRETSLLAAVLADLYGGNHRFLKVRRWLWQKRLEHSNYDEIEAVSLLMAAKNFVQYSKQIEALTAITLEQIQALINAMSAGNKPAIDTKSGKEK